MNTAVYSIPRSVWGVLFVAAGLLGLAYFHQVEMLSGFASITGDHGDNRFIAYTLEHAFQSLSGHASILSPAMFYPEQGTLGYSDTLFAIVPIYAALRGLGLGILAATQWTIMGCNLLTYLMTLGLLRRGLKLGPLASLLGALFFAFNSAKLNQLNHLQLQPLFLISAIGWILVTLYRQRDTLSTRQSFVLITVTGLLFDLQLYTSVYIGWYFAFQCLLILIVAAFWRDIRNQAIVQLKRHKLSVVGAVLLSGLALIPFLKIYLPVLKDAGWRNYGEVSGMIPQGWSYLYMGHLNFIWGWLPNALPKIWALPLHWEHRIGLGAVVTITGIMLFVASCTILHRIARHRQLPHWIPSLIGSKDSTYLRTVAIVMASVGLFYLLGTRVRGPGSAWWLIFHTVPGARSIRAVSRFVLITALPLTCLYSVILDNHVQRLRQLPFNAARVRQMTFIGALMIFALCEQLGKTGGFSVHGEWDRISHFVKSLPDDCQSFYVTADASTPYPVYELQLDAMLVSVIKGVPTLNGYSGQSPKQWELWEVRDPAYDSRVQQWIAHKNLSGKICKLAIDR